MSPEVSRHLNKLSTGGAWRYFMYGIQCVLSGKKWERCG